MCSQYTYKVHVHVQYVSTACAYARVTMTYMQYVHTNTVQHGIQTVILCIQLTCVSAFSMSKMEQADTAKSDNWREAWNAFLKGFIFM